MAQIHAEILRGARGLIESEREEFVCIAVQSEKFTGVYHHTNEIRSWIRKAMTIDGVMYCTLNSWLNHKGFMRDQNGDYTEDGDYMNKIRKTRLAWIDWMIDNHHIFD
jgi:hypothetical protein